MNIDHAIHCVAFFDAGEGKIAVEDFIEPGWHLEQFFLWQCLAFLRLRVSRYQPPQESGAAHRCGRVEKDFP